MELSSTLVHHLSVPFLLFSLLPLGPTKAAVIALTKLACLRGLTVKSALITRGLVVIAHNLMGGDESAMNQQARRTPNEAFGRSTLCDAQGAVPSTAFEWVEASWNNDECCLPGHSLRGGKRSFRSPSRHAERIACASAT
jgi:hypothetical protein